MKDIKIIKSLGTGHETTCFLVIHPSFGQCVMKAVDPPKKQCYHSYRLACYKKNFAKHAANRIARYKKHELYHIPKTFSARNGYVFEEFADSIQLSEKLFHSLSSNAQNLIINAIAHFFNDMDNAFPIFSTDEVLNHKFPSTCVYNFDKTLTKAQTFVAKVQISPELKDQHENLKDLTQVINDVRKKLANMVTLPDPVFVMRHRDLKPSNIFWNEQSEKITILDFAEAGYVFAPDNYISYPDFFTADAKMQLKEAYCALSNKLWTKEPKIEFTKAEHEKIELTTDLMECFKYLSSLATSKTNNSEIHHEGFGLNIDNLSTCIDEFRAIVK